MEGTEEALVAFGNWIIQKCNQWLVDAARGREA